MLGRGRGSSDSPAHSFLYGEGLDFPLYEGRPRLFVCLHFVPRSGSNLLADLMRQTERLGFPLEYFSPANLRDLASRLPQLSLSHLDSLFQRRTSPNGVFSYKWNSNFQALEAESRVARALTPRTNVFIDRRDLDAQARSFLVASKTGIWARQKGVRHSVEEPDLSPEDMEHAKEQLSEVRAETLAILCEERDPTLTVYAEDLFEEPASTVKSVMEYCGVSIDGLSLPATASQTAPSATHKAK